MRTASEIWSSTPTFSRNPLDKLSQLVSAAARMFGPRCRLEYLEVGAGFGLSLGEEGCGVLGSTAWSVPGSGARSGSGRHPAPGEVRPMAWHARNPRLRHRTVSGRASRRNRSGSLLPEGACLFCGASFWWSVCGCFGMPGSCPSPPSGDGRYEHLSITAITWRSRWSSNFG